MQFHNNESLVIYLNNNLKYLLGQKVTVMIKSSGNSNYTLICENGKNTLIRTNGYIFKYHMNLDELYGYMNFPIEANIYGC
jgi:hypothetical protein